MPCGKYFSSVLLDTAKLVDSDNLISFPSDDPVTATVIPAMRTTPDSKMVETKAKPASGDAFAGLANLARIRPWPSVKGASVLRPSTKPAAKQELQGTVFEITHSVFKIIDGSRSHCACGWQ